MRINLARILRRRVFSWSILIASIVGLIGVFALANQGMFMEPVAPVLGVPYVYQTIGVMDCSFGGGLEVCAPVAVNNVAVALVDLGIFFAGGFLVSSALLAATSRLQAKMYAFPVTLLIGTSLLLSAIGVGSTLAGASWTQPHWSTPSGIEVRFDIVELASGSATSPSSQGSAFLATYLANYHWTVKIITLYVYPPNLTNGPTPTTHQTLYQCQSPTSCKVITSVILQPYSVTSLDTATTAVYFGYPITIGVSYGFAISGYNVGEWTNVTAS